VPTQAKKVKNSEPTANESSDATPAKKFKVLDKSTGKKDKKAVKTSGEPVKDVSKGVSASTVPKQNKISSKKQKATEEKVEDKDDEEASEDTEDEIDDQTEALLQGFESNGDEDDDKAEDSYEDGMAIPAITDNKELSRKKQAKLKKIAEFPGQGKPGVVFVGRIPHGFYEHEMKAYFGQFGQILKLRLSRNRKTGASKHYAFIQFQDASVADIVAKAMDNYLMFGHLLKVKLIPDEQVPAKVFEGANKRFKKVPWNKLAGRQLEQGASEEVWEKRNRNEQERRDKKARELKAIGYEFDSPALQSAKGLSKQAKAVPQLTENDDETEAVESALAAEDKVAAIETAPLMENSSKPKKKKKKSKDAKEGEDAAAVEEQSKSEAGNIALDVKPSKEEVEESVAALITETTEKSKKEKKAKKNKELETPVLKDDEVEAVPANESSSKQKKDKKKKAKVIAE
jgi:nucleolar protein 15